MASKHKVFTDILCLAVLFMVLAIPEKVYAETRQAEIISLERQQDLVVLFYFEKEVVDITFISPSGVRMTSADPGVEVAFGDLWSTYRISDAESGDWSVEYDLKRNSYIQYSVVEENYGLWIQYFTISDVEKNVLTANFQADCENRELSYKYEIYAIGDSNMKFPQKLISGQAMSNENHKAEISLAALSSGNYQLRLNVTYSDGNAELFDSMLSYSFDFSNTKKQGRIEDYQVNIDVGNLVCDVIWDNYARGNYESYRLIVSDGEEGIIYDGILEHNVTSSRIIYPEDITKLAIALFYQDNGIWSEPLEKEIDLLQGEYLRPGMDEVTGSGQFILEYFTDMKRPLSLSVNDAEESGFSMNGEGYLGVSLKQGNNTVHAVFEGDNNIFHVVDTEIYYDAYPPEINLYEELDGKTYNNDRIDILGSISGGNALTANGENVEIDASGEFSIPFQLISGENVLILEAFDINGNSTVQVLTFYRPFAAALGNAGDWIKFLPLFVSLLISTLIAIWSILFLKKRDRVIKNKKKMMITGWILLDISFAAGEAFCIYKFLRFYENTESLSFLEIAERSASDAMNCLRMKKIFGIASATGFAICILFVLLTILVMKRQKKERNFEVHKNMI